MFRTSRTSQSLLRCNRFFSSSTDNTTTHFGFRTVEMDMKEDLVGEVFRNVAEKYDVMNDAMSFGVHRLWKDSLMRSIAPGPTASLLDVAGGTGDIAFRFLDYIHNIHGDSSHADVTVVDINQSMLDVGKGRLAGRRAGNIQFQQGNAEDLTELIPDNSKDLYTIAFGIRNCTNVDRVLSEAYRVLKPGGRFTCLEFSRVDNAVLRMLYDQYSFNVIPAMGQAIANDRDSYQYLVESIRKFPPQKEFADMIRAAGFQTLGEGYEDMTFGAVAMHTGWKI